jgi:hypothetical protein
MMTVQEGGRTVVRALEELRVHPALEEIGFCAFLPELNEATRSQDQMSPEEPICVTHAGLILSGFGRWRMAVLRQVPSIECVEYSLTSEDALQLMLSLQKRRSGWNTFIRIRLALKLEKTLQQRALTNMQMGGKHKGSATLPKAAQIDVREQIATMAGVGGRNVSKVKEILEKAHPRIKDELLNESISINRAHLLCRIPLRRQLEALTQEYCDRAVSEVEGELLFRQGKNIPMLEATAVLNTLLELEVVQPGSVSVQLSRRRRSVILVGEDLQARIRQSTSLTLP